MLDAGCWISKNAHIVKSKNIEDPETSIQDQPILARVFVATDFDGDGHVDIAATNDYPDTIVFLRNDGSGSFGQAINYDVGDLPLAVEVVDYNLDGDPDILTCNHSGDNGVGGDISLLLNRGDGTFDPFQTYSLAPDILSDFTAADFDGDGDQDIAVTFYNGTWVSVFFNNVNTAFSPGDFNKDGDVDADDLELFAQYFGSSDCSGDSCICDMDGDQDVDGSNLAEFIAIFDLISE